MEYGTKMGRDGGTGGKRKEEKPVEKVAKPARPAPGFRYCTPFDPPPPPTVFHIEYT